MKIATAQDVRRLDESVIVDFGVDQAILMENAAIAARDVIESRWKIKGKRIILICGIGNNGGDGFALARLLYARGAVVSLFLAGDTNRLSGAAETNYRIVKQFPVDFYVLDSEPNPAVLLRVNFTDFDIIVDALFGTGLSRKVEGRMAALIQHINDSKTPVLSLDIPSGIDADTGKILGIAVNAKATVSFGILKRGNLLYPGHQMGGQLYYSEISFPPEVYENDKLRFSLNIPPDLSQRDPVGHKGSFGKILVVGGSSEYRGAPALTAAAALRGGAGYVRLAVPAGLAAEIFQQIPEAVLLPQDGSNYLKKRHLLTITSYSSQSDVTILGSGLSTSAESLDLARELIQAVEGPLLIDGDALTALAGHEELTVNRKYPSVLSPHAGEIARLLGTSVHEVEAHRVEIAIEAAERYGSLVILKGAHSIIADKEGLTWLNLTGNSAMGTAGSGDVLSGLLGASCAVMSNISDAVRLGVYLHGLAGDLAAEKIGEYGVIARDILSMIPEAIRVFPQRKTENPYSNKILRL